MVGSEPCSRTAQTLTPGSQGRKLSALFGTDNRKPSRCYNRTWSTFYSPIVYFCSNRARESSNITRVCSMMPAFFWAAVGHRTWIPPLYTSRLWCCSKALQPEDDELLKRRTIIPATCLQTARVALPNFHRDQIPTKCILLRGYSRRPGVAQRQTRYAI